MKLLNELISLRRIDDEPELDKDHSDEIDSSDVETCPDCLCDPCICDDDEDQDGDIGGDEHYMSTADEFDTYGEHEPHDKWEDEAEETAIDQGYAACEAGQGRETNPYPQGTPEHEDWDWAWQDAHQAMGGDDVGDEPQDMTDVEADADTLRNIGWGTDEDYGHYSDEERGMEEECPACNGTGKDYGETCVRCGGSGRIETLRSDDEYEDEEPGRADQGAYDQQGAHMGGAKETDTQETDYNPDAADELDLGDEMGDNAEGDQEGGDGKLDALADKASEDPDKQGVIRTVKNAHLVYKRQIEDGTYEELWIYNIGNMRDELDVRKAILAGTDIPTSKTASPDGTQQYELWSAGNAEILQIKGLPN